MFENRKTYHLVVKDQRAPDSAELYVSAIEGMDGSFNPVIALTPENSEAIVCQKDYLARALAQLIEAIRPDYHCQILEYTTQFRFLDQDE